MSPEQHERDIHAVCLPHVTKSGSLRGVPTAVNPLI
jgi:hypothetical protein